MPGGDLGELTVAYSNRLFIMRSVGCPHRVEKGGSVSEILYGITNSDFSMQKITKREHILSVCEKNISVVVLLREVVLVIRAR